MDLTNHTKNYYGSSSRLDQLNKILDDLPLEVVLLDPHSERVQKGDIDIIDHAFNDFVIMPSSTYYTAFFQNVENIDPTKYKATSFEDGLFVVERSTKFRLRFLYKHDSFLLDS